MIAAYNLMRLWLKASGDSTVDYHVADSVP